MNISAFEQPENATTLLDMGRAALGQAHRLFSFSETRLAMLAQMNIPYAVEILLLLRFVELLVTQALAHGAAASLGRSAQLGQDQDRLMATLAH